jgi:triacylglycerol lipase
MLILFALLGAFVGAVFLIVLLSHAIAWYESASDRPELVPGRFAAERLWLATRLIVQETLLLLVTVLLHPWGWVPPRQTPFAPTGGPPVILLHGLFHNRACWWWVKFRLRRKGLRNLYSINLPPWKDIEALTERLTLKVDELRLAGAGDKVHLVGHSMGGIIARNYLQLRGGAERVDRCVLLAAPNHGSKLAPFAISRLGEALVPGSTFLNRLNAAPLPHPERITAICSRHDNIVLPWQSARLPGVRNIELSGMGHVGMLYCPSALAALIDGLCETLPAQPPPEAEHALP